ncbi:MAG: PspA/IM30 family protein, partial [Vicinamibacterales bacterium]
GHDDLARATLRQQRNSAAELALLEAQIVAQQHEEGRLALLERQLAAAIDAWNIRRELAGARLSTAEARAGVGDSLAGLALELTDVETHLHDADMALDHLSARAAAIERLTGSGVLRLADSEPSDPEIEAELARLRGPNQ